MLLIVSSLVVLGLANGQGFMSPGVAPYFGIGGPFYGGMLFRGLFGGFGGLGGFGGGLGGFGFPGATPFALARGKREVTPMNATVAAIQENIECTLSNTLLNCTGEHELIECEVKVHNVSTDLPRLKSMEFVLKEKIHEHEEEPVIKLIPKKLSGRLGGVHHRISIFSHAKDAKNVKERAGFEVIDHQCFLDIASVVQTLPEKVKLTFN